MLFRPDLTHCIRPANTRGFSLVELMVAMAIGLIIAFAVTQAYVNATFTQRAQSDVARLQESARFAFDSLAHGLRKAGYKNPNATSLPGMSFCELKPYLDRFIGRNDAAGLNPASADLSGTTLPVLNSSDVLRVRYYGEGIAAADGSMLDCLGNSVAANVLVEDTFFVAADAANNNEPTLFCYTSNAPASGNVPLIPGVESLQILYIEDINGNATQQRMVPIGSVGLIDFVRGVMLSVVVRTSTAVAVDQSSTRTFNHFGTAYAPSNAAPAGDAGSVFTAPADGRIRQQSSTTVALRNLCP